MSAGDPSGKPNPFSSDPISTPSPGYVPPPSPGADVPMILGIISIVLGVIAVPLSCCACVGVFPGGLAVILGIVALVVPGPPGSPGKYLGIGGIALGVIPYAWAALSLILGAVTKN